MDNVISVEELFALSNELGLSLSCKNVSIIAEHYHPFDPEAGISPDEIRILDVISKHYPLAQNSIISTVISDDKEVNATLYDLYSKAEHVGIFRGEPLSITEMAEVSKKYLNRIGISAPDILSNSDDALTINDSTGNLLVSFESQKKNTLPYGYIDISNNSKKAYGKNSAFAIVFNANEEALFHILEKINTKNNHSAVIPISNDGILDTLLSCNKGVLIDLERVSTNKLTYLLETPENACLVAVSTQTAANFTRLANEAGLEFHFFARAIEANNILLHFDGKTRLFENPFSAALSEHLQLRLTKEEIVPTDYNEKHIAALPEGVASAILCYSDKNGFATGMNVVIDSLFSLLAQGVDRRRAGLALKLYYPCVDDAEKEQRLSYLIASLLGAYRAMIELCVPDAETKIVEEAASSGIFCSAFTKDPPESLPDTFCGEGNGVYLMSFGRFLDTTPVGMPNFDNLRSMCDYLYSLFLNKKITAIRAFNGSALNATKEMQTDELYLEALENENSQSFSSIIAEGFIIESPYEISAPKIGVVKSKNSNDCEAQT